MEALPVRVHISVAEQLLNWAALLQAAAYASLTSKAVTPIIQAIRAWDILRLFAVDGVFIRGHPEVSSCSSSRSKLWRSNALNQALANQR